jgi:hypothetical protein
MLLDLSSPGDDLLSPQTKTVLGKLFHLSGDLADTTENFLKEDLEDGVGTCEPLAHFLALDEQVLILVGQSVPLRIAQVLVLRLREELVHVP